MLCLEVSGDFACFTRPEMKAERVSYDVITPSAARAIFEAVLWKPALRWQVRRVDVLKPIRWVNLRRNEVGGVVSARNAKTAMNAGRGNLGLYVEDERQQRAGLFLRDVAYRIHAEPLLTERAGPDDGLAKFVAMFQRRARKGQCFNQPYLGCREFSCDFQLVQETASAPAPIDETRDLGWMLYDLDFSNAADPQPRFFNARMNTGSLEIPDWHSAQVRG